MSFPINLVILGCGTIGRALVHLASKMDCVKTISVLDSSRDGLDRIDACNYANVTTSHLLLNYEGGFGFSIPNYAQNDSKIVVINALPHYLTAVIAADCVARGFDYFDLTEDVNQVAEIKKLIERNPKQVLLAPQQGLAPGAINVIAAGLIAKSGESYLEQVKLYVGAITPQPYPPLDYAITWSIDGLVNEYFHKSRAIIDGYLVDVEPLGGYEQTLIGDHVYEAFYTAGGLGSLTDTVKAKNLSYKTVRFVGHRDKIKFLINDLKMDQPQLREVIAQSVPRASVDEVVMKARVESTRGDLYTWEKKIPRTAELSAIQLTTASGVLATLELHAKGLLPKTSGFLYHTEINADLFLSTQHGQIFE